MAQTARNNDPEHKSRAIPNRADHKKVSDLILNHIDYDLLNGYLQQYFLARSKNVHACKQDLLPLLVNRGMGYAASENICRLTAVWALYLAAAHLLDNAQDTGDWPGVQYSFIALGVANSMLADLNTGKDTLQDILAALGQVTALSGQAQASELEGGRDWSREGYFRYIAGKSATIIATGIWLGGRLSTTDDQTLELLKAFGLALGMTMQLGDDCMDLAEDLRQGTYTLPVIEGLQLTAHEEWQTLKQLTDQPTLLPAEIDNVIVILRRMGVMTTCQRLVRAYQVQAEAALQVLPDLKPYFANYVAPQA